MPLDIIVHGNGCLFHTTAYIKTCEIRCCFFYFKFHGHKILSKPRADKTPVLLSIHRNVIESNWFNQAENETNYIKNSLKRNYLTAIYPED